MWKSEQINFAVCVVCLSLVQTWARFLDKPECTKNWHKADLDLKRMLSMGKDTISFPNNRNELQPYCR